ncbi:MAG: hypothetical protein DRJ52_10265 [Thermoprotei archaeon]|nr:MAG: hypothetical protein DRJ52_10265 [Thermoprotei archaeon]RLF00930.1 MAG: hypothetical protein DRJ63_00790 [Thermoprotei archaeon]HDI74397.1 hypothetical protein [Thermoprotei archaeon]
MIEVIIAKRYYSPENSLSVYGESPPPWKIPLDYYRAVILSQAIAQAFSMPFKLAIELQNILEELVEEGWKYLDVDTVVERLPLEISQVFWSIRRLFSEYADSTSIFTGYAPPYSYLSYVFGLMSLRDRVNEVTVCDAYLATPSKRMLTPLMIVCLYPFERAVLVYPSTKVVPPLLASLAERVLKVSEEEVYEYIEPQVPIKGPVTLVDKIFPEKVEGEIAKTVLALLSEGSLVDRALIDALVIDKKVDELLVRRITTKLISYGLITERILPNGRAVLSLTRKGFLIAERVVRK